MSKKNVVVQPVSGVSVTGEQCAYAATPGSVSVLGGVSVASTPEDCLMV